MLILSGLILLAVLIIFHELGHFLFAKMLGVKVLVFSLGFGPKILSFKQGDTEYRLSAIPLGGYVRMYGESLEEELTPEQKKMSFIHQAIWRKSLIAFAGPLFNFILPIILFFGLLVGKEQVYAPIVGTLLEDGIAQKAGILPDDRIERVNSHAVETFSELAQIIAKNPGQEIILGIKRPMLEKVQELEIALTPEAKASQNMLEKDKLVGRVGIMPAIEKAMVIVDKKSVLANLGLNNFDIISAVNNQATPSMHALQKALEKLKAGDEISLEREKLIIKIPENNLSHEKIPEVLIVNNLASKLLLEEHNLVLKTQNIIKNDRQSQLNNWGLARALGAITKIKEASPGFNLGLREGDRLLSINGEKISSSYDLQQSLLGDTGVKIIGLIKSDGQPAIYIFRYALDNEQNVKLDADLASVFGVSLSEVFKPGEAFTRHVGVWEAFKRACVQTYTIAAMTGKSLWLLISGAVPASQVGGPIMIFDVAQQAAHKGLSYYIFIMCLMSVNLGLLNLLPIPALDGGHLLLFGIEAVQRKPLTPRTRAIATQIGFALLLALMGLAIFNDLYRLFK